MTPADRIDRGVYLADLQRMQGWAHLLALLDAIVDDARTELLGAEVGSDKLPALHAQARAAKTIRDLLIGNVNAAVEEAKAQKQALTQVLRNSSEEDPYYP